MYLGKSVITMFAAVTLVMSGASAATQEHVVTYRIHEVPNDWQSDVVFVVSLTVKEAARDGNSIGWEITAARFEQPGSPSAVWVKESPMVSSPDGRWWISHADADHPTSVEFAKPPQLAGTATAQGPESADLSFAVEGVPYMPGSGGALPANTGALDYKFTLVGASTPLKEGEDEPVEIDPFVDPPGPY